MSADKEEAAFIVHNESPGQGCPWPIHCGCCLRCYWTSRENEEAALAAGMQVLCIYCALLFQGLGEEIVHAGAIKNGKVIPK